MSPPDAPSRPAILGRFFWRDPNTQFLILAAAAGLLGGFGAIAFRFLTQRLTALLMGTPDIVRGAEGLPLWARVALPAAGGLVGGLVARFFFGGFGNNYVDHREIQQFRGVEAFPGIGINTVSGANYGRAQVEWTLPPLRFRRVGVPSMYLRFAQLSLFATGLVTDVEDEVLRRGLASAGAQVDATTVVGDPFWSTVEVSTAPALIEHTTHCVAGVA